MYIYISTVWIMTAIFLVLDTFITKKKKKKTCVCYVCYTVRLSSMVIILRWFIILQSLIPIFSCLIFLERGWWRSLEKAGNRKRGVIKTLGNYGTYFQCKHAMLLAILNYLYLNYYLFSFSMLMKGIKGICFCIRANFLHEVRW